MFIHLEVVGNPSDSYTGGVIHRNNALSSAFRELPHRGYGLLHRILFFRDHSWFFSFQEVSYGCYL